MKRTLAAGLVMTVLGAGTALASIATARVGGLSADSEFNPFLHQTIVVDLLRQASGPASFSTAAVIWAGGPLGGCKNEFHLLFYRPVGNGTTLSRLADRGPFDSPAQGLVNATLTPPVALVSGDVMAIEYTGDTGCGGVAFGSAGGGAKSVAFSGPTGPMVFLCDAPAAQLLLQAPSMMAFSGGTEFRDGIVAGVGSFQGTNTNFKSGMQLVNPGIIDIHGRLVFHPIGSPGSSSDPTLPYSIPMGTMLSLPDVVSAMGVSGLGSIDVICDESYPPLIVTHVYNDAGAAGAAGFTEPTVRLGDPNVLQAGDEGWLLAPADTTNYRMNIGVRSLSNGAVFTITVLDPTGNVLMTATKTLPADELVQESVKDFLGIDPDPNDLIVIDMTSGNAIVYGVTVNNVTNDTGQTFATRTRF